MTCFGWPVCTAKRQARPEGGTVALICHRLSQLRSAILSRAALPGLGRRTCRWGHTGFLPSGQLTVLGKDFKARRKLLLCTGSQMLARKMEECKPLDGHTSINASPAPCAQGLLRTFNVVFVERFAEPEPGKAFSTVAEGGGGGRERDSLSSVSQSDGDISVLWAKSCEGMEGLPTAP